MAFSSLPEPLIHYIQSFLTGKEAAQTSTLSKFWCTAWLTRPSVDFDQSDFRQMVFGNPERNPFALYTKRTLQRYADLDLKIDSFKLRINGWERAGFALANDLLAKAIGIGAKDINFRLCPPTVSCGIPAAVLGSGTLTRLSLTGCKIEAVEVHCSRLKSLDLSEAWLEENMIWGVLSSCPLIENLALRECKSFSKVQSNVIGNYIAGKRRMLSLSPSFELHKLRTLVLEKVKISSQFFSNFSSKFPCMKILAVLYCYGYKEVDICSPTLEFITFAQKPILRATFDVKSIRRFNFDGSNVLPWLVFKTDSKEWESDVTVCCKSPSYVWFNNLNRMLKTLSSSTIYLAIDFLCAEDSFDFPGEMLPLPVVENLTLHASYRVSESVLDGIFWSCRPKIIIQNWLPGIVEPANNYLLSLLFKVLTREGRESHVHLHDLEEVYVVGKDILKHPPLAAYDRTLCFQMIWGRRSSTLI